MTFRRVRNRQIYRIAMLISIAYIFITLGFLQTIRKNPDYYEDQTLVFISDETTDNQTQTSINDTRNNNVTSIINIRALPSETEVEKIDWNDYILMTKDAQRQGLGENGNPAILSLTDVEKKRHDELLKKFNYNAYLSDAISLERSIGDLRTDECKKQKYIGNIPENSVSIIIIFHNEKNSTLLRTVHSVINRSPAKLIREIILVDDLSSLEEIKAPILEDYISRHFTKVRVIRNKERLGLIRSRIVGADASSGTFLVFFDAHIEVNYNYLPPLLEQMVLNYTTIPCPTIDTIPPFTFQCYTGARYRGIFDWSLTHRKVRVHGMDKTTPHSNPVMSGGAFAITRKWWEELGKYDPGLKIWGGEQFELSFKSWLCGGSLVDVPCSRVAHVFRPLPYLKDVLQDNTIEINLQRVTTVWMDEFKEYVLKRRPLMQQVSPGNITQQLALRARLQCKSFKWFLEEIATDILQYFPIVDPPSSAWGRIRSNFNTSLCIVAREDQLFVDDCSKQSNDNYFHLNWKHHIMVNNWCISQVNSWDKKRLTLVECLLTENKPAQMFAWNLQNGRIVNYNTNNCVDVNITTFRVVSQPCNFTILTQSWQFDWFNATEADRVWELAASTRL